MNVSEIVRLFLLFVFSDESIHFLYFTSPKNILREPNNNKNCSEYSRIGEKTDDGVLHPVCNISNWQHDNADNQKVDTALH